jgi:hypothetical protein
MVPTIGEGEARFLDVLVKVVAAGIAIGTVWVGFQTLQRQGDQLKLQQEQIAILQKQLAVQQSQFETTSKEQVKALEEEYHRRFWEKKLEVYIQLCHAAGILALTDPKSDEYLQAQHQLTMIYNGELQLLASPDVKTALGNFLEALSSASIIKLRDPKLEVPTVEDMVKEGKKKLIIMDLHMSVAELALACRQDSGSEFHLTDQEVTKYKAGVEDFFKNWEKWGIQPSK